MSCDGEERRQNSEVLSEKSSRLPSIRLGKSVCPFLPSQVSVAEDHQDEEGVGEEAEQTHAHQHHSAHLVLLG